jgi:hypothetical protein
MKTHNKNWYDLQKLYTLDDLSSDKLTTLHDSLFSNAVNKYLEENGLNKSNYRCLENVNRNAEWFEPSYLILFSRKPELQIVKSITTTYNFSYTYENEKNNVISIDTPFTKQIYAPGISEVKDNNTLVSSNGNETTYSYTYILDIENTYAYGFVRKEIYLQDFWNNEFITRNILSDTDLEIKYNLDDKEDVHMYEVSSVDYINGKIILTDKLSNKTLKVNFGENIEKILNI